MGVETVETLVVAMVSEEEMAGIYRFSESKGTLRE